MGCGSSTSSGESQQPAAAAYQVKEEQNNNHTENGGGAAVQLNGEAKPAPSPSPPPAGSSPAGGGESNDLSLPRKSINSKRLTLPSPSPTPAGVGTTALNLALAGETQLDRDRSGSNSARGSARGRGTGAGSGGNITPPGSARRRKDETEDNEMLVSIPFFEALDTKAIRKLRDAFTRQKFSAGEWISRVTPKLGGPIPAPQAGASAADFFVIISGNVQLSVHVPTSKTTSAANKLSSSTPSDPTQLPATEFEDLTLATLKDGQWFGADALVQDSFQKADVLALTDCVLLSISREAFRKFAEDVPTMHTSIADVVTNTRVSLRSLPFFASVDELKLQQLSQLLEFRRFKLGEIIVKEGEMSDGFYVIVSGSSQVTVHTRENATFLLSTLKDGDYFGETSLLSSAGGAGGAAGGNPGDIKPSPRVATVTATSDMLTLYLSSLRFARFGRLAPEVFSDAFNKIASQRTTQLLKTIPLFDVLCLEKSEEKEEKQQQQQQQQQQHPAQHRPSGSSSDVIPAATALSNYDEGRLALLASLFSYESYDKPKTVVFREGDRADKLYIIIRGSVEVSARVESGIVVLNKLTQGMFFGEISMMFPTLRSASITTLEPCLFLSLTSDKFSRFLSIAPELKERLSFAIGPRVASIIENIPFFRNEIKENKPWSKLGLLGELCSFEKREENEVLFKQGDLADKFYVIVAGAVLVTKAESGAGSIPEESDSPGGTNRRASGGALEERKENNELGVPAPAATHKHSRAPTILPGVILRRGNYFGEEFCERNGHRWGTVTSLALSVFLTLSKENFDKYVKIAPELGELIRKRQQSSNDALEGSSNITPSRGNNVPSHNKNEPLAILRVAANQSLESSPIFETEDEHGCGEFQPSKRVASQHPNLSRLATTVPQKTRTIHQVNRAASILTDAPAASLDSFKAMSAPSTVAFSPQTPTNRASLGPLPGGESPSGTRPGFPQRLPSLTPLGSQSPNHGAPGLGRKPSLGLIPLQPLPEKRASVIGSKDPPGDAAQRAYEEAQRQ